MREIKAFTMFSVKMTSYQARSIILIGAYDKQRRSLYFLCFKFTLPPLSTLQKVRYLLIILLKLLNRHDFDLLMMVVVVYIRDGVLVPQRTVLFAELALKLPFPRLIDHFSTFKLSFDCERHLHYEQNDVDYQHDGCEDRYSCGLRRTVVTKIRDHKASQHSETGYFKQQVDVILGPCVVGLRQQQKIYEVETYQEDDQGIAELVRDHDKGWQHQSLDEAEIHALDGSEKWKRVNIAVHDQVDHCDAVQDYAEDQPTRQGRESDAYVNDQDGLLQQKKQGCAKAQQDLIEELIADGGAGGLPDFFEDRNRCQSCGQHNKYCKDRGCVGLETSRPQKIIQPIHAPQHQLAVLRLCVLTHDRKQHKVLESSQESAQSRTEGCLHQSNKSQCLHRQYEVKHIL